MSIGPYRILNDLREFDHPDLSRYVLHFTGRRGTPTPDVPIELRGLSATQRLVTILAEQRLRAFRMFQTPDPVVCFTECTAVGVSHVVEAGAYEPVGLAFEKNTIFHYGGGPAHYVRGDVFHLVGALPPQLRAFCTRYWPGIRWKDGIQVGPVEPFIDRESEWIHEREWRILGTGEIPAFHFGLSDVAFVLTRTREQAQLLLAELVAARPDLRPQINTLRFIYIDESGIISDPHNLWIPSSG